MYQFLYVGGLISLVFLCFLYNHIGFKLIGNCMMDWLKQEYWIPHYNKVEFAAYLGKIIIIFPGLVFGIQVWWFYIISLATSSLLIWVSMRKLLPTLIAFNSIWIVISILAITKHFMGA